ncbi:MAG TPA: DUF6520 family protein [Puia sp.]|nr:DUF6520 family protein [Puia sp.]
MKKIKLSIMTLAIALSIGGAFATSPRQAQECQANTQYYNNGGAYVLAGKLGIDYLCQSSAQVCTYYKIGSTYVPCMNGIYCTANCKATTKSPKTKK